MRAFSVPLVLFFAIFLPTAVFSEPLPKIDISQSEFNFADIFQGEKVTHVFTFANRGDAPLVIERVKSSCGCTAALLSSKKLLPGEEGTIKATFDSARFRGKIHKVIMLYSNSPGNEVSRFDIRGKVKPLTESDPDRINFGDITIGTEKQLSFTLVNKWNKNLKIENIRTSNTAVSASSEAKVLLPGAAAAFSVTARPVESTPHLRGYVLVRTDYAPLGEIRVPFQGVLGKK